MTMRFGRKTTTALLVAAALALLMARNAQFLPGSDGHDPVAQGTSSTAQPGTGPTGDDTSSAALASAREVVVSLGARDQTLPAAAMATGLRESPDVIGFIDVALLTGDQRIEVQGWAHDLSGDSAPLAVIAKVDGTPLPPALAKAPRPDVVADLGLPESAVNLAFSTYSTAFSGCLARSGVSAIAITNDGRFGVLKHGVDILAGSDETCLLPD